MRLKSDLYTSDQLGIIDKIINILELDNEKSTTLYDLDNDEDKQLNIISLIPEIRIFFSASNIQGVSKPDSLLRPWLSIIRQIAKKKYKIIGQDCTIKKNNKLIRTKRYYFYEKQP